MHYYTLDGRSTIRSRRDDYELAHRVVRARQCFEQIVSKEGRLSALRQLQAERLITGRQHCRHCDGGGEIAVKRRPPPVCDGNGNSWSYPLDMGGGLYRDEYWFEHETCEDCRGAGVLPIWLEVDLADY